MIQETNSKSHLAWRAFTGKVATPTLFFFLLLFSLYSLVVYLGVTQKVSFAVGCFLNAILTYLIFTPLHEATHGNISGKSTQLKSAENIIGWIAGTF